MSQDAYSPSMLASREFAEEFSVLYDTYIELRVSGKPRDLAVIEAFDMIKNDIDTRNAGALGIACDVNPYVKERFDYRLAAKDIKKELWSLHRAVWSLLSMVEDPGVRDATRLNAIGQLNLLCKYVDLDDGMKRRIGHTLADFQKLDAAWKEGQEGNTGPVH